MSTPADKLQAAPETEPASPEPGSDPSPDTGSAPSAGPGPELESVLGDEGEPDLEHQVDSLLAEVTQTVEEIQTKISEADPNTGPADHEIDPEAPLGDSGESEVSPRADEPAEITNAAGVQEALEDALDEADSAPPDTAEPEASIQDPASEPAPTDEAPTDTVTPESLTEHIASPEPSGPADDPAKDAASSEDTATPAEPAEAGDPEIESSSEDGPGTEPSAETADATAETPDENYGTASSLDDELAALASHALDEDLDGAIHDTPAADPPPAAAEPADPPTPERAGEPEAEATPDPATEPARAPAPAALTETESPESAAEPSAPAQEKASAPTGPLRWGWLPPKPDWPQCYSRLRPLVIAWRHAVWTVPPFVRHVIRLAAPHARRAEPRVRHALAVAATPLSKRDRRTRSAIGWLACNTLFWGACLWVWILWARSPAVPELSSPPTALQNASEIRAAALPDD